MPASDWAVVLASERMAGPHRHAKRQPLAWQQRLPRQGSALVRQGGVQA